MKKAGVLMLIMIGISLSDLSAQYRRDAFNGIGLRLGTPLGVSYKMYLPRRQAMEFIIGTTPEGWYDSYYRDNFDRYDDFDDKTYDGHIIDYSIAFSGRYLFHMDFPERVPGFEWYYGFGGQLRLAGAEYQYLEQGENAGANASFRNKADFALGPEGIAGLEYVIPNSYLTAFADASLFMELVDNPLRFRFQAGIGLRYDF